MQAIVRQPQRAPDGAPVHYERRRPEQTALYRLVQRHSETYFAYVQAAAGAALLLFVKDEFGRRAHPANLAGSRLHVPRRLRPASRPEADQSRAPCRASLGRAGPVRRDAELHPVRRRALRSRGLPGAGTTVPIHHAPGAGRRPNRGELKLLAVILEAPAIERSLEHVRMPTRAPPRPPARTTMSQAA
jgi:hypothetical protein